MVLTLERRDRWFRAFLFALLPLALAAFIVWRRTSTERELGLLDATERSSLYEKTRDQLARTCRHPPGPELSAWCEQQAEFLRLFPECDADCRALTAPFRPTPSR